MNVDELNSKNAVCRVGISPKLKELTCILCIESLWNSSLPGRLLPDQAKSPARVSELWKSLSAQSWEKKAVGQKLFVKTLPEATKTWWQVVSAIYVCFWMARCEIFKGFSWACRCNHQEISTTNVPFYHCLLILSNFNSLKPTFLFFFTGICHFV